MNEISKPRKVSISEGDQIKLDESFKIINEIMMKNELAVLRCNSLNLVVTYLGENDMEYQP